MSGHPCDEILAWVSVSSNIEECPEQNGDIGGKLKAAIYNRVIVSQRPSSFDIIQPLGGTGHVR